MTARQRFNPFYTAFLNTKLEDSSANVFGQSIAEYQIYRRTDISNLGNIKGYYIHAKQRLIIPNSNPYTLGAAVTDSYKDYPAVIQNKIKLALNNGATARISKVFPRTLNSQVTLNSSSESGKDDSTMKQTTSGSSYSNVNTFGVNVSGGVFMGLPMAELGLSYSHSWGHDTSLNSTSGSTSALHSSNSNDNSMSVKDWSAYSHLNDDNMSLSWVWGQSYPWDVILYNYASSGDNIDLPKFVEDRMISGNLVLPPSELSLFGLDFTAQASWIVEFPDGIKENETITISHETTSYNASHSLSGGNFSAKLQTVSEASSTTYSTPALDLSLYSLSPIGGYASDEPAAIGFKVDTFSYPPSKNTDQFKILSATNDLQVTGTGFDSVMTSSFTSPPTFDVSFKISDTSFDYSLIFIHWIEGDNDCLIEWSVNDKFSGTSRLDKSISTEGQANLTRISIRNRDYESLNFHDYLVVGMNTIKIKITPIAKNGAASASVYNLSSIAIR